MFAAALAVAPRLRGDSLSASGRAGRSCIHWWRTAEAARTMPTMAADLLDLPVSRTDATKTTLREQLGPDATVVVFGRHYG